jgi:cysteate synthase
MGTTVLSAATTLGYIPDSYYQAVGSGTGAIAAWEANLRLIADGRFGKGLMRLMVSQNAPFLLIHDSWKAGSRDLVSLSAEEARAQAAAIYAKVLSNRKPPYGITGGLFDALTETDGDVIAVTNEEAKAADRIFRDTEGIDPEPAAAVAVASLISSVKQGHVDRDERVLLNVTGGGIERVRSDIEMSLIEPAVVVPRDKIEPGYVAEVARDLLSRS